jgi:phage gp36-like protein
MPYSTLSDLIKRAQGGEPELIQLTDRNNLGAVDASVVDAAIADADSEIDSYLSVRYPTPVTVSSARLTAASCDIALYRLHQANPPDPVEARYKEAILWLRDIAAGKAGLPGASGPVATDAGLVELQSSPSVFGRAEDW